MSMGQPELIISSFFLSFVGKAYIHFYQDKYPTLYYENKCNTDDSQSIVECLEKITTENVPILYDGLSFSEPLTIEDLVLSKNQNEENNEENDESDEINREITDDEEKLNTSEKLHQLITFLAKSLSQIELIYQLNIN